MVKGWLVWWVQPVLWSPAAMPLMVSSNVGCSGLSVFLWCWLVFLSLWCGLLCFGSGLGVADHHFLYAVSAG